VARCPHIGLLEIMANVRTGIKLEHLMHVSMLVENLSRRKVASNKPIVGRGLFDMETGIGADLYRKMKAGGFNLGIQPFAPDLVGQEPIKLVFGKNSGTADQIKEITDRVKREGRIQRALLTEAQFQKICREIIH